MDLKEMGVCGVVVIGGAVYGISQVGLGDALSEDLRAYHEVPAEERAAYMQSVVAEFSDTFETYSVQTQTYEYTGYSTFSAQPIRGLFDEVVSREGSIPKKELPAIKEQLTQHSFCSQDEMMMFTNKGWNYRFKLKDGSGRTVTTIICQPSQNTGTA